MKTKPEVYRSGNCRRLIYMMVLVLTGQAYLWEVKLPAQVPEGMAARQADIAPLQQTYRMLGSAPASSGRFIKKVITDESGTSPYQIFVPSNYSKTRPVPLVVYLHGASERGTEGDLPTTIGLGPFLEKGVVRLNAIVVFPQAPFGRGRLLESWTEDSIAGKRLEKILAEVEAEYAIDPAHRVLTGWSMGGYGVWNLAAAHPERWSALVPLAGGADEETAKAVAAIPVWAFHGSNDPLVPVKNARASFEVFQAAGGVGAFTELTGVGHEVWLNVYGNPQLYEWMLSPGKVSEDTASSERYRQNNPDLPFDRYGTQTFEVGMTIPKAAAVKISPSMLSYLSEVLADEMRQTPFRGAVQAISQSSSVEGHPFSVTFSGNSYSANVQGVTVVADNNGLLTANIALSPIQMTLGRASIRGVRRQAASTGPINITAGMRGPVILSLSVRPSVLNGRFVFQSAGVNFSIDPGNYAVSTPAVYGTSGWGVTPERVSSGIVQGLYGSKSRIEQEVRNVAPSLISTFEQKVNEAMSFASADDVLAGMWPMPFYQPRVRVFAESVQVSSSGIAITLGLVSAGLSGGQDRSMVASIRGSQPVNFDRFEKDELLKVSLDTGLFEAFTRQIVSADIAEVHVLDVPVDEFHVLSQNSYWEGMSEEIAAALEGKQAMAYLKLVDPVLIKPTSEQDVFELSTNGLMMELYAADDQGNESPVLAERLTITQKLKLSLDGNPRGGKMLAMAWLGDAEVKGISEQGVELVSLRPDQHSQVESTLKTGWERWIAKDDLMQIDAPSIEMGAAQLQLNELDTAKMNLIAGFGAGKIKIINTSQKDLLYRVATRQSSWSSEYRLPSGRNHEFTTLYPYRYRGTQDGKEVTFTLPLGGMYEYRVPQEGGEPQLFLAN